MQQLIITLSVTPGDDIDQSEVRYYELRDGERVEVNLAAIRGRRYDEVLIVDEVERDRPALTSASRRLFDYRDKYTFQDNAISRILANLSTYRVTCTTLHLENLKFGGPLNCQAIRTFGPGTRFQSLVITDPYDHFLSDKDRRDLEVIARRAVVTLELGEVGRVERRDRRTATNDDDIRRPGIARPVTAASRDDTYTRGTFTTAIPLAPPAPGEDIPRWLRQRALRSFFSLNDQQTQNFTCGPATVLMVRNFYAQLAETPRFAAAYGGVDGTWQLPQRAPVMVDAAAVAAPQPAVAEGCLVEAASMISPYRQLALAASSAAAANHCADVAARFPATEDSLARRVRTAANRGGTEALEMYQGLVAEGWLVDAAYTGGRSMDDDVTPREFPPFLFALLADGVPIIVNHINYETFVFEDEVRRPYSHYSVIVAIDRGHVILADPAAYFSGVVAPAKMPMAEFLSRWKSLPVADPECPPPVGGIYCAIFPNRELYDTHMARKAAAGDFPLPPYLFEADPAGEDDAAPRADGAAASASRPGF